MTKLVLFNSLSREKEVFTPIDPAHVKLYACGPTVYNYAHIGNARMAVVFDVLARVLKAQYPRVTYVSNITDVDDKIIAASASSGESIDAITAKYTQIYNEDMAALGCAAPDIQPRATAHIGDMIALIERLVAREHAYASDGHVLFHVPSFEGYGALSGRSRDEQVAGARVEVASYKKDPADFVLWKPSSDDEPGWDSPWGRGRPGWHIECSAMIEAQLGLPIDIHGGGADLKFPHHENEIAQSCCAHGIEDDLGAYAKYWVHNGFLTVEGEKMSKSLGNFLLAHDLLKEYRGEVLRLAMLFAHYRQPLDWSAQVLHQAEGLLNKMYTLLYNNPAPEQVEVPSSVMGALCDDLNTPQVISALHALVSAGDVAGVRAAGDLLGLLQSDPAEWLGFADQGGADFDVLLAERAQAKAEKNWARADEIRDEIAAQGYEIIDTPEGSKVRKI
ncbi:MAG: cysteine--tRNA ligase [Alphaproteobacteria bacterium]